MAYNILAYEDPILEAADKYGLDPWTALRMGQVESAGNPFAVSSAGAKGLYQTIDSTSSDMGIKDPYDPFQSITGGLGYYDKLNDQYGSPILGAAAYNWGPGNLNNLISDLGTNDIGQLYPKLPKETQGYIEKIFDPTTEPLANLSRLKQPLLEPPNFTSPSKYADVEIKNAAMPSFAPRRADDLNRVNEEITSLEQSKNDALQAMSQQGNMKPDQALALALTAIVPALLGMGIGGGLKGAAAGAQAGLAGANVGLAGINEDVRRRDLINRQIFEDARQRLTTKEAERRQIGEGMSDAEERGQQMKYQVDALNDRSAAAREAKAKPEIPNEVIQEIAKRTGQDPNTVRAFSQMDPYQMQTMMYAMGANVRPLSDSTLQQISSGKGGKQLIKDLRPLVEQMSGDNGLARAVKSGNATSYYKQPGTAAYDFYAKIPVLQKMVAGIMESGKLTDQDVTFLTPFITGSILYDTPQTIQNRLNGLEKYLDERQGSIVDTFEKGGRNVSGFKQESNPGNMGMETQKLGAQTMQGPDGKTLRLKEIRRSGN